jgi:hypothetical protein
MFTPSWCLIPCTLSSDIGLGRRLPPSLDLLLVSLALGFRSVFQSNATKLRLSVVGHYACRHYLYSVGCKIISFTTFQGFLLYPWSTRLLCGRQYLLYDVVMRKKAYSEKDLFDSNGLYGSVNKGSILLMGVGSIIGWGFGDKTPLLHGSSGKGIYCVSLAEKMERGRTPILELSSPC